LPRSNAQSACIINIDEVFEHSLGGKINRPSGVSLPGNVLETPLHVRAIGSDLKFNSVRREKAGQLVYVSGGSSYLLMVEATAN
jgi:hypothetical protein